VFFFLVHVVLRRLLRLLKERDDRSARRLEELRREIAIGLEEADRGEVAPLDIEGIKAEGRRLKKKSRQAR